jgi:DNA-binding response OmpR family regulator
MTVKVPFARHKTLGYQPDPYFRTTKTRSLEQLAPSNITGEGNATILAVVEEPSLRDLLLASFQQQGYHVVLSGDEASALTILAQQSIDLVVLDVMISDSDGFAVCASLRNRSDAPIILLSDYRESDYFVYGLQRGADDYVLKPFKFRELTARVKALLRREAWNREPHAISTPELFLAPNRLEVRVYDRTVQLTSIEYQLLRYLMSKPNQPISRSELRRQVWGNIYEENTSLLDVAILRLRSKIEKNPTNPCQIVTIRGFGYKFNSQLPNG